MANQTVQVDDFDSLIQYSQNDAFNTPDPSNSAQVSAAKSAGYLEGTYHETGISGAYWGLNFTGTSISVYGSKGPALGSFDVALDGSQTSGSAYAPQNASSVLLFSSSNLAAGPVHNLKFTNTNASTILDYVRFETQIGASGSNVQNTTVQENNLALKYVGQWGNNTSPQFSGGGSAFTNGEGASVTLTFNGSAIYAWGDVNSDHGEYAVTLDSEAPVTMKAVTGCGLPFKGSPAVCERTQPGLLYTRSYLSQGSHTLKIENVPGVNKTYFDLDRFEYSTPSSYLATTSSQNGTSGSPSGTSPASSSSPSHTGTGIRAATPGLEVMLLAMFLPIILLCKGLLRA